MSHIRAWAFELGEPDIPMKRAFKKIAEYFPEHQEIWNQWYDTTGIEILDGYKVLAWHNGSMAVYREGDPATENFAKAVLSQAGRQGRRNGELFA